MHASYNADSLFDDFLSCFNTLSFVSIAEYQFIFTLFLSNFCKRDHRISLVLFFLSLSLFLSVFVLLSFKSRRDPAQFSHKIQEQKYIVYFDSNWFCYRNRSQCFSNYASAYRMRCVRFYCDVFGALCTVCFVSK